MAEEFRIFLRVGLYVAAAGLVYWLMSSEASGSALLAATLLAAAAFIVVGVMLAGHPAAGGERPRGLLSRLNRLIGFDERVEPSPLAGGPDVVPLSSAWPIASAAAATLIGLGLVFGTWLLVPGAVLLAASLVGWLAQGQRRT